MAAKIKIEQVTLAAVTPFLTNARLHSAAQVSQIAASITEFGFNNPILIDAKGSLVAGHGRVLAAQQLGLEAVPAIRLGHLTPTQVRAFRLADNQLALNATWDQSLLADEIRALAAEDFDVGLLGFSDFDLTGFLAGAGGAGTQEDDDAPPPPAVPVARMGDTWLLGEHRLRCGSSTSAEDVAALLGREKPLLMVTDPPYGVNYDPSWRKRVGITNSARMGVVLNDDVADWREAWALFPGNVAYVWHGGLHAGVVQESLVVSGFDVRAQIIWVKESLVMGRGHYHWQHEPCLYGVRRAPLGDGPTRAQEASQSADPQMRMVVSLTARDLLRRRAPRWRGRYGWLHETGLYAVRAGSGAGWNGNRKQTTVWGIPTRNGEEDAATMHSTQKPVECMRRPIINHTKRGDAVYDPFSGSFTTGIAGETTGRRVFAMELSPAYVDASILRWQAFTGAVATLEGGGTWHQETSIRLAAA